MQAASTGKPSKKIKLRNSLIIAVGVILFAVLTILTQMVLLWQSKTVKLLLNLDTLISLALLLTYLMRTHLR